MAQGLSGLNAVDPGCDKLTFEPNEAGLLGRWNLEIGGGEEGNDVARQEQKILALVAVEVEFARIERNERGRQGVLVETLDDGVRPVDIRG
jgi:hypothetical protein